MEERVASQIAKDAGVLGVPVRDYLRLVGIEILVRPGKVTEELRQLFLSFQIAAKELSSAQGEGERRDEQRENRRIQKATATRNWNE